MDAVRLNLGCGRDHREGWVNVDIFGEKGVDVVQNLDSHPYPWPESSVDEIYSSHVIEHLREPADFLEDCHRVLKNGGIMTLKYPHREMPGSANIYHRWQLDEHAIDGLIRGLPNYAFYSKGIFEVVDMTVTRCHTRPMNWLRWHSERYLHMNTKTFDKIFCAGPKSEVYFTLRAVK